MLTPRQKKIVINEFKVNEADTGSSPVQVALLTKQINELTAHLKQHPKDHISRRGLLKMVGRRRRLFSYLKRTDERAYNTAMKKLKI